MKSALSRPNQQNEGIESAEDGDLEDPHDFESVGTTLAQMFAKAAAAEEKKTDR